MNSTLSTRAAAFGAALALGAGVLVTTAPAAEAKVSSVKSSYSCATDFGDQVLTVKTKVKLPAKVKKGKKVGAKPVTLTVTLPQGLSDGLRLLGISSLSGSASGVKAKAGKTTIKISGIKFTNAPVPASGQMTFKAKGKTAPVKFKKAGKFTINVPKSFKFSSADQTGGALTTKAPCTLVKGSPAKLGSIKVTK
ncbi:DUF6801 domain-containing protein [Nocardioides pantholopis]|uniref:DUF6801 domain-containing protein n=1 Tax=Nocardioides pantholopis TaxID=2483798 RepID=UPI000FD94B8E|nr:DUF6801 domain-containing protein [Nocardioides pantholopis]